MAMSGQQIYDNFMTAPGPGGLDSARTQLQKVMEEYQLLGAEITALAGSFEDGWTGDAAGAAQRGAGPLAVEHGRASEEMNSAQTLLDGQIGAFDQTKNAVVPVPAPPQAPSTMLNIVTFGSASSNYENKVAEANAAAATNTVAMDGWTTESSYNEAGMPKSYGALSPTTVPIALDQGSTPPPIDMPGPRSGDGGRKAPGDPGTGPISSPGGTGQPGAQTPPGGGQAAVPPNSHSGSGNNPGGGPSTGSGTGSGTAPSSVTTPGGYTPGSLDNPGFTPGGLPPGSGTSGGGASSSGGGAGSSSGGAFSGGLAGGFGVGGSPGIGGGASGNLAEGKGSGSAAPGAGTPAGAKPGGISGSGAAGKPGGPGGPMGGGGQKGQGSEDEEHQRKYVIDDDSAFQLNDEDGQKVIDPRTGLPLVPPVIGT